MITPQDIQDKLFDKAVRGYNADQVDEFLDALTLDMETLINEKNELAASLEAANAKLEEYKVQEGAVVRTLESAKALMNDISASAEKRADIIMKNAELDADRMLRAARESVEKIKEEETNLTYRVNSIKQRFKNILQAELDRFEDINTDLFGVSAATEPTETVLASAFDQFNDLTVAPETEKEELYTTRVIHTEP